jgi:hypothetical protein
VLKLEMSVVIMVSASGGRVDRSVGFFRWWVGAEFFVVWSMFL